MTAPSAGFARLRALFLAIAIGAAGGAVANWFGLPLAWMIGAMAVTTVAAFAGAPVVLPMGLRSVMVALLGVMLGSSFTPDILQRMTEWAVSLAVLVAYVAVAGTASMLYFRRFGGYDRPTAFFSAMPGGLSEMILVGSELGGDGRIISLVHASRLLLVILILPFAFQLLLGYDVAARPAAGPALELVAPADFLILAACGVAGFFGAKALRLPAAAVVGPMVLSAALHLAGWTEAKPPVELVAAAQVVVGTSIGCRFAGVGLSLIGRTVVLAGGSTVILISFTLAFAFALNAATDLPITALVLAFSPGGLAEMSLIALALSLDAAFVATHHIVRIFLVVVLAPAAFRARERRGDSA